MVLPPMFAAMEFWKANVASATKKDFTVSGRLRAVALVNFRLKRYFHLVQAKKRVFVEQVAHSLVRLAPGLDEQGGELVFPDFETIVKDVASQSSKRVKLNNSYITC